MISRLVMSPIGALKLTVDNGFVTGLEFHKNAGALNQPVGPGVVFIHTESDGNTDEKDQEILNQAIEELEAYFAGRLRNFSVPVKVSGTQFQQAVWQAMQAIGYGETKTYRDLAVAAGSPGAARAVGNACAANPVAIIIPCHRVVAQNGLGGFGGGLDTKQWLLGWKSKCAG